MKRQEFPSMEAYQLERSDMIYEGGGSRSYHNLEELHKHQQQPPLSEAESYALQRSDMLAEGGGTWSHQNLDELIDKQAKRGHVEAGNTAKCNVDEVLDYASKNPGAVTFDQNTPFSKRVPATKPALSASDREVSCDELPDCNRVLISTAADEKPNDEKAELEYYKSQLDKARAEIGKLRHGQTVARQ